MKGAEAALVPKGALITVGDSSVVVLDDESDTNLGPHIVDGRRSLQAAADFEVGFMGAGTTTKGAAARPEEQQNQDLPNT